MQISISRTVTLFLLTVMITLNSFGQTFNSGDHFFNMNVYRVNDDSPQVITVVCKDGPLYVLQMQGNKILTFSIDGRNIPTDSLGRYQTVIDTIKYRIKEEEEQAKRDRAQGERDREQAGRDREQADRDRLQAERDRQQELLDRDHAERSREQAEQDREQAGRDRQQAMRDREQAERDRAQAERDRIRAEEDRKMMDSLIRDLIADGIVTDRDSVHSLKVDADEVIVNGKRLPDSLEKKYIARYVKKGFSMSYHNE
jgi:hypothetical protein